MIAEGVQPPQQIIQAEREPAEWLVMTQVKGRKHPAEMRPGEPSEVFVLDEGLQVVPIDETVA